MDKKVAYWFLFSIMDSSRFALKVSHITIAKQKQNIPTFKYGNIIETCEMCLKLTIKALEWSQCKVLVFFIVNFEQISYIVLVYLLLTLKK